MELVKKRQGAGSASSLVSYSGLRRNFTKSEAQEQAGSLRADKQLLRIDELELLFKAPTFGPPAAPGL